jgi:hypothetical protein
MLSSVMLRRVAPVRTDVADESQSASVASSANFVPSSPSLGTLSFKAPEHVSVSLNIPFSPEETKHKTNSLTFSAQANYTDLATATERRNLVSTFAD